MSETSETGAGASGAASAKKETGLVARLLQVTDGLAMVSAVLAILFILGPIVLILYGTVMGQVVRYFPNVSVDLSANWEWSAYMMGACFLLSAAAAVPAAGHVRVSILVGRLKGPALLACEILATLVAVAFAIFLFDALLGATMTAISRGQKSAGTLTPLWIPNAMLTFGAFMVAVQFCARLLRLLTGRPGDDRMFMEDPAPEDSDGVPVAHH
ncbi:TRAP transporter small permease [Pseudooceanicola nanhaiensis]|uniref:TRAP transporter small permease n=1 Tax=Pseudooceanicola nanhaiensis TaxID=375761 RepID=UPI001CD1BB34|nr:TRAP transporter small permease [Pseudooceanicola nanhaiensis]MCA0919979.1 TRAP transporter small permease [Pseudooceanicola nanhaiensis]